MTNPNPEGKSQPELIATVVICTRNRSSSLKRTLNSVVDSAALLDDALANRWELLVVDNGSSDDTQDVVLEFESSLPIRSTIQPVPGLSNARNAGIDAANGRFILWTDDDVLVDENWLSVYLKTFQENPDIAIFGGRAVPRYEEPATDWFVQNEKYLKGLLAVRDAPERTEITPKYTPYGLNYAFRRDVQMKHRYDPELGVAPGRRIGGEETAVIQEALRHGANGLWVWDATVYHLIPLQRQTLDYIIEYYRPTGFQYPTLNVEDIGAGPLQRLKTRLTCLKVGFASFVRRSLGRENWVASYVQYARWMGTLDLLKAKSNGNIQ